MSVSPASVVTLFIWPPSSGVSSVFGADKSLFGHAAMQTYCGSENFQTEHPIVSGKGFYISLWRGPCSKDPYCKMELDHFHTRAKDDEGVRQDAETPKVIHLRIGRSKVSKINAAIKEIAGIPMRHDLFNGGGSYFNPHAKHCAGLILFLLSKAKIQSDERKRYLAYWTATFKFFAVALPPLVTLGLGVFTQKQADLAAVSEKKYEEYNRSTKKAFQVVREAMALLPQSHPKDQATVDVALTALNGAEVLVEEGKPAMKASLSNANDYRTIVTGVTATFFIGALAGIFFVSERLTSIDVPSDVERVASMHLKRFPHWKVRMLCHNTFGTHTP